MKKNGCGCHECMHKEQTIEKAKPKINIKKLENKYINDPLYIIFGKQYLQKKKI